MHTSKEILPAQKLGDYEGRSTQFGDYYVTFESLPAGSSLGSELFRGLLEQACQAAHWGYLFRGKFKFTYPDGTEEVVSAGEAYYAEPGHLFEALEDCEGVEFSPKERFDKTIEVDQTSTEPA